MAHKILDKVHDQSAATMKSEDYENDLVFLYCGTNNCAGYDPIKKRVVYLPQQILSIEMDFDDSKNKPLRSNQASFCLLELASNVTCNCCHQLTCWPRALYFALLELGHD